MESNARFDSPLVQPKLSQGACRICSPVTSTSFECGYSSMHYTCIVHTLEEWKLFPEHAETLLAAMLGMEFEKGQIRTRLKWH